MYSVLLWFSEEDKRRNEERVLRGMDPVRQQKNTAAGVKKYLAKRELKHDLYLKTLRDQEDYRIRQSMFKVQHHTIATVQQQRVGLTAYDDKRFVLEDGLSTRAHGHYLNKL